MLLDVTFSFKVEVYVVGEVHDCRSVALGGKSEFEGVVITPLISCHSFQVAGITGFTILGEIHELNPVFTVTAVPNLILEAFRSSVKMVGTVVDGKGVLFSVEGEMAFGYAVSISSGAFSGAGTVSEI